MNTLNKTYQQLFDHIAHGDEEHKKWLYDEMLIFQNKEFISEGVYYKTKQTISYSYSKFSLEEFKEALLKEKPYSFWLYPYSSKHFFIFDLIFTDESVTYTRINSSGSKTESWEDFYKWLKDYLCPSVHGMGITSKAPK